MDRETSIEVFNQLNEHEGSLEAKKILCDLESFKIRNDYTRLQIR